jgi:NET1-associated nuclear protein 1 (U3 small nucleolar RNA-associated protein 17)
VLDVVDAVSKKVAGALSTRAVKSSDQGPSKKFEDFDIATPDTPRQSPALVVFHKDRRRQESDTMADATPQLKRKAEEAAAQKKAKKQRKSDAAAQNDSRNGEVVNGAANATPATNQQSNSTPKMNGASKDTTTDTPTKQAGTNGTLAKTGLSKSALKKKEKKERKEKNRQEREEIMDVEVSGTATDTPDMIKKRKNKKTEKWVSSRAQGGWFIPADPVFSSDEKYLLVADSKSLRVYATETSLLANTLSADNTGILTAYTPSPTNTHLVYVAYSNGHIILWNWVVGKMVGRWNIGATVQHMTVTAPPGSEAKGKAENDLIYCHEADEGCHTISVRVLLTKRHDTHAELKQVKQVLSASSAVRGLQVLLQGKYVVAATTDSIVVGKRAKASKTALEDFEYVWREFKFSKHITTFSVFHREQQDNGNQRDVLDIAVGEETGVILLFEDILASFAMVEKSSKDGADNAASFRPKRLHWHRDAVGSIKWSLDGNYIISGGDETVLTIWQLATGQPQHLPHLSAAIENVVVSPTGSAYALALANNSVIVLSTTELEARTNIIGIQSRRIDFEQLPKDTKSGKYHGLFDAIPMAINPANPAEVFFSVPSSQPRKSEGFKPEPYLQTYDIANERARGRQALTRNNATEPNVTPDGGRINEPTVTHLQVSHDGEWLATIDEVSSDCSRRCETYTDYFSFCSGFRHNRMLAI